MQKWILASRPKTLPAAISPVLVGIALAYREGSFGPILAVSCILIALLMQIVANLANDLFDHQKGVDTSERLGPVRVTASGMVKPQQMWFAIGFLVIMCLGLAINIASQRGSVIYLMGGVIVLAALLYSGGKLAYGYIGLGDVFVFLFFGIAATTGTYYVLAGKTTLVSYLVAIPPGLLITNILVVNNIRDRFTDEKTGKRTLAVLLGRDAMLLEFGLNLLLAFALPILLVLSGQSGFSTLLPLFALPMARTIYSDVRKADGKALNPILGKTANLALVFCLLFGIGLIIP